MDDVFFKTVPTKRSGCSASLFCLKNKHSRRGSFLLFRDGRFGQTRISTKGWKSFLFLFFFLQNCAKIVYFIKYCRMDDTHLSLQIKYLPSRVFFIIIWKIKIRSKSLGFESKTRPQVITRSAPTWWCGNSKNWKSGRQSKNPLDRIAAKFFSCPHMDNKQKTEQQSKDVVVFIISRLSQFIIGIL